MVVAYLVYRDVLIAVDIFSVKKEALKPGETRILDSNQPLKPQVYEALSGNKWNSTIDKIDEAIGN